MCQTEPVSEWSESWVSNVTFYYWIRNWLVFLIIGDLRKK